jgi:CubicO group peptidase (beta-lactamase class C family)
MADRFKQSVEATRLVNAGEDGLGERAQQAIDALFAHWGRADSPGCAVGIVRDRKLVYARGYGCANLDYGIPITPRTTFGIGSESKQFTGACIALLVEEGALSLEQDIRQWVPGIPAFCPCITVDHLVHHTSGLPDYHGAPDYIAKQMDDRPVPQDELVDFALRRFDKLDFAPGTGCSYSNTGYLLLAVIVQAITGMSFGRFLRQRILDPLGMRQTYVYLPDEAGMVVPNRAIAYVQANDGSFHMLHHWHDIVPGDGKMISTVGDLAIWDRNFYTPQIGGERFLELMHSPGRLVDGSVCPYGFGLDMGQFAPADCAGVPLVTHGGGHGGFESLILRLPSRSLSVILLCNIRDRRFRAAARQIATMLCQGSTEP